jgi:hypothetical protein
VNVPPSVGERLADQRYVTLIVRLLLDPQSRLVRGEIGGVDEAERHWIGFTGPDGLTKAVEAWLAARPGDSP